MEQQLTIMTTQHPDWRAFCDRLAGPEGCDFKDGTWLCGGGNDKSFAAAILEDMGNIDIARTLAYFDRHGGHCDCEILFNVDREQPDEVLPYTPLAYQAAQHLEQVIADMENLEREIEEMEKRYGGDNDT